MVGVSERISLTEGNIKNHYIRLRQLNGLIPQNVYDSGATITLDLDGVGQVSTVIDAKKGILSEREAIGRFFDANALHTGDEIIVEKIGHNHLRVAMNRDEPGSDKPSLPVEPAMEGGESPSHDQLLLFEKEKRRRGSSARARRPASEKRANDLDGRQWTSYSISVWRDIRKTSAEQQLRHPAMFPVMLVQRIIKCFTTASEKRVLDPFMGSGSTLVGACQLGRAGIGLEVYPHYIELAQQRLALYTKNCDGSFPCQIHEKDARQLTDVVDRDSIDLCITSPPYWNILSERRTADYKQIRNYGDSAMDLGQISEYVPFVASLGEVFRQVLEVLKPGKYCVVNVMDLRKRNQFYPYHSDLAAELQRIGFIYDDIIIWDRSHEYNNLRPLGYPAVFRVNKVHEYLLIFQKPKTK